jgi:hypothetical protein
VPEAITVISPFKLEGKKHMPRETKTPKKNFTFGTCSFANSSPNVEKIGASHRALNVFLSFEEALKLNLAVDEAVRRFNSYNRATREGKTQH